VLALNGLPIQDSSGQSLAAEPNGQTFDVASVKTSKATYPFLTTGPSGCHGVGSPQIERDRIAPGRCHFEAPTLRGLIAIAFAIDLSAIEGLPRWAQTNRYQVDGVADNPATVTHGQLLQMLRSLLMDRFSLRFHKESRVITAYELILDKVPKFSAATSKTPT